MIKECRILSSLFLLGLSCFGSLLLSNEATSQDVGSPAELKVLGGTHSMVQLVRQGNRLSVEYSDSVADYQPMIKSLRRELSGGSSSSSRGGGGWLTKMNGPAGTFAIVCGNRAFPETQAMPETDGGLGVLFEQNREPFNELSISAGPNNKTLKLQLSRSADDFLFCFEQTQAGAVHCKLLNGSEVLSLQASDYESLVREHWAVINSTVSPILVECGVSPPLNRYAKPVWTQFLVALRPVDDLLQQEFNTLLDQLDSTKFANRERATSQLTEQFDKWQGMMVGAVSDAARSVECRSRLGKILDDFATPVQQQVKNVLDAWELEADASYLIWLAERLQSETDSKADQALVFEQLEKVTGEKFGNDLTQWRNLNKAFGVEVAQKVDPSIFKSEIDLSELKGVMELAREDIGNLLPLRVHEGGLALDRGAWLERFGRKTPEQLVNEISNVLKENNLPLIWLQPAGLYLQETVGYPQILFQTLRRGLGEGDIPKKPASRVYRRLSRRSLNREFDTTDAKATLRLHKPIAENQRELVVLNGRVTHTVGVKDFPAMTEEFVFFEFTEKKGAGRKFVFKQAKDGSLSISLNVDGQSSLLRYIQRVEKDGSLHCSFQDLRGADVFVASATGFKELVAANETYYEQHWRPVFDAVGLVFPNP